MKHLKLILFSIIMLLAGFAKAQKVSRDHNPKVDKQKICCPDTTSLISGLSNDFANANLLIEKTYITKNSTTHNYFFTATVIDSGDDCSSCTKIIILLPAEVKLISYSAVSGDGKKFNIIRCYGTLLIDVGQMCPAAHYPGYKETYVQQIRIKVETSDHTTNVDDVGFAIMAYSKVPDLKQENNYWYGRK